jgi:hypothetical protein
VTCRRAENRAQTHGADKPRLPAVLNPSPATCGRILCANVWIVNVANSCANSCVAGHMRSSSWSQVESSALIRHGGTTTRAEDVERGARSLKGAACGAKAAHQGQAGKELGVSAHWVRELLRRMRARATGRWRTGCEGSGRTGGYRRERDLAPVAAGSRTVERPASADGASASVATAAGTLGRVVAVGHQHPRLAGRPRAEAVSDCHDRRCHLGATARFVDHDSTKENLRMLGR